MTTHHPFIHQLAPRPFRCLRHRPFMASCDDCRKAHTPPPVRAAHAPTSAR